MHARPGIAKLLRAPWNFEVDYDNVEGDTPILFTGPYSTTIPAPGVPDVFTALDQEAAQLIPPPGISPLLAKMMPVPMGSTLLFMFPIVQDSTPNRIAPTTIAYVWRAIFRMRTVADFQRRKQNRVPWSIPLSRFGSPDTRGGHPPNRANTPVAGARVVRPACSESVIFNRSAPGPQEDAPFFGLISSDAVRIPLTHNFTTVSPRYPGSALAPQLNTVPTLDYEQGERDPALFPPSQYGGFRGGPFHLPKFLKCVGNEVAVECFKVEVDSQTGAVIGPADWQFGIDPMTYLPSQQAPDFQFSLLLGIGAKSLPGNPPIDTGVRVLSGAFPQ